MWKVWLWNSFIIRWDKYELELYDKKKCEICGQMYESSISTLNFYNKMNICNKCLYLKNKNELKNNINNKQCSEK